TTPWPTARSRRSAPRNGQPSGGSACRPRPSGNTPAGPGVKPLPDHFGGTIGARQANVAGRSGLGDDGPDLGRVTRVGSYPANAVGLYDMPGNFWKRCLDLYEEGYSRHSPREDPHGLDHGTMYVLRGGSCYNPGTAARSANRHRNWSAAYGDVGFWVVFVA